MPEDQIQPVTPVDRLCSEIQLFDLCTLDKCEHRNARFCTNQLLLNKFEAIKEEDDRQALLYDENEFEDDESDLDKLDEEFNDDL